MKNARDLSNHLVDLYRRERHAMADFLLALAAFDQQRGWRELGHASLFAFLRRELRLSAGAAQYRKTAAELIQRHPQVEAALRSGDLCLSSIIELAKVVTPENLVEILPRFFGLSRREAADVAVSIRPVECPPRREVVTEAREAVRAEPVEARTAAPLELRPAEPVAPHPSTPQLPLHTPAVAPRPAKPSTVEPLDAEQVRLHLTVSRRLLAKLEAAKDALSHALPGATSEEVLEACLDLMLAQQAKRKGIVEKPRKTSRPPASSAIPAAVKREVWKRAGGTCEWRLDSGAVCGSTVRLEFDHIAPRALGGSSKIENLRLLCRGHHDLVTRRVFGDAWIDRFARGRAVVPRGRAPAESRAGGPIEIG